ncbi:MAG: hypothetical protein AAF108_03620 [Planctomycetota bacterium]
MSAKWRRVQAWDDRVFPAWAWAAKAVLRAFSSISLAVVLLTGVSLYAVFASVPIGLLALAPTWAIYAATLLVAVGVLGVLPAWLVGGLAPAGAGRFAARVVLGLLLAAGAAYGWWLVAWPRLHFDPATGDGLRLFAGFVDRYDAITLRRLPGFEMTELEFYSWWPMRVLLLLFVANMVVATLRRIEFTFHNLGVLTVHTGIVVIALGSVYYQKLKQEGDTILLAGPADAQGVSSPGPAQRVFYDGTRTALWINQFRGWQQRPLSGVPRYNDYGLDAGLRSGDEVGLGGSISELVGATLHVGAGRLSVPVPPARDPAAGTRPVVDPRVNFEIVGYSSYAEPTTDWVRRETPAGSPPNPMRLVYLYSDLELDEGQTESADPFFYYSLTPERPSTRFGDNTLFGVEYTIGLDDDRFADLAAPVPPRPDGRAAPAALIVRVPGGDDGQPFETVVAVQPGDRLEVGETGYRIEVEDLLPEPPFPIITPGYEGATSDVALIRVTEPAGGASYTRWVYSRFPELSQDLLDEIGPEGRPVRRDADPGIEIVALDISQLNVFFDEDPRTGLVRAVVREPSGSVRVVAGIEPGTRLRDVVPEIDLELGERWAHAERFERPRPVPEIDRDREQVGTHDRAMLAVEVTVDGFEGFSRVVWLPFVRYMGLSGTREEASVRVELPTGEPVELAFGRLQRPLPGFQARMLDFEMLAYDHRGAPRDYQTLVRVEPAGGDRFEPFSHVTKLNAPLKAPFRWSDERPAPANVVGELASHLSPNQFKLSQAGWDQQGWFESQRLADEGLLPRPRARFTILQVGNNPGIHVIAFGGVLMSLGIPWAFYVKPWLVRRKKRAIQREIELARAGSTRSKEEPGGEEASRPEPVGASA